MTFDFKNSFHSELSLALKNQNHSYLCKIQHEMNNQNTRHIIQQHHQSFNPFSVLHSNTFFSPMMISPPKFIQNSHSVLLPVSHFSKSDTLSNKPKFDQSLNKQLYNFNPSRKKLILPLFILLYNVLL